jgi:DNA helicase-2/ATP-dependent DNA helicase PcrA
LIELSENKKQIIQKDGHLIIIGGPGSGKTFVSILKASHIANNYLTTTQKVLFLSFARPTVSRVIQAIEENIQFTTEIKNSILVDTYHSFFWKVIKAHGYLVGLPRKLSILSPPSEAVILSAIRSSDKSAEEIKAIVNNERFRLATEEGRVCFDLFAHFAGNILHGSDKIRRIISGVFPVIILDEFQDTNSDQWRLVIQLGLYSKLIALADPKQRIYDFLGASQERIDNFKQTFTPSEFDISDENYRNKDTEITIFGDDLISGNFKANYKGIVLKAYPPNKNQAYSYLKYEVLNSIKRLKSLDKKNWSVAILTPTKKMMRQVSDALLSDSKSLPSIHNHAMIDVEGVVLSAEIIAFLLQPNESEEDTIEFILMIKNFFLGRGGDKPTKLDIYEAERIGKALEKLNKKIPKNSILLPMINRYTICKSLIKTGNPDKDWLAVRSLLEQGTCKRLKQVAEEAKNIKLLDRGTQLRDSLSRDWRENGLYNNALKIVRQAFIREHFSTTVKPETGVIVMNMHKAKGKQFDEVIIFEGWPHKQNGVIVSNPDRIILGNKIENAGISAKYNFRVSATRAKLQTTIMTPEDDPCILFT